MRESYEPMKLRDCPELWNHMNQILQTKIKLYEFAAKDSESMEGEGGIVVGTLLDAAGLTRGAQQHAEDTRDNRSRIIDGLIHETGGGGEEGVPFAALRLWRFVSQFKGNGAVQLVILELVANLAEEFVRKSPEAVKKIQADDKYRLHPRNWDRIENYISQGVLETLGFGV